MNRHTDAAALSGGFTIVLLAAALLLVSLGTLVVLAYEKGRAHPVQTDIRQYMAPEGR